MNKQQERQLFFSFLDGSKRFFAAAITAALLMTLFDMLIPQLVRMTIDAVIGGSDVSNNPLSSFLLRTLGGRDYLRGHLFVIALAIATLALCGAIFRWLATFLNAKAGETLINRLHDRLFHHIERLPFSWHMAQATGDIIQRCTSDVRVVKDFCAEQLYNLVRICMLILMGLSFMFSMQAQLTLVAIIFIPLIVLYSYFFHRRVRRQFLACDENEGILSTIAQENLTGVRVVRAFGREAAEEEKFRRQNDTYTNLWMRLCYTLAWFWGCGDMASGLQVMAVVAFGAYLCVQKQMTVGAYIAFISYNAMLVWPIRALGRMISEMSKAGVSVHRIAAILHTEAEELREDTSCDELFRGDICFEHVSFRFEDKEVLSDMNFTVAGGQTVGILGSTGSGKSVVMQLLDRLYPLPPSDGTITIGGKDIAQLPLWTLRKHIGIVLQDPFLFSGTIRENIGIFGKASDRSVKSASHIAALDDTIDALPDGLATIVGERGVTLSGGQKQRVAIARMLTMQTPIMIFDDSLSAVDAETDARIRHRLKSKLSDATVFLISHRVSTLMDADVIFVMDGGRIIERGTHEELMAKDGQYAKIYRMQSQPEEEVAV